MNGKLVLTLLTLLLINSFGLTAFAQRTFSAGELVLEVKYSNDEQPMTARQEISESEAGARWAWYSRFKRIADRQPPDAALQVRAVKFIPYLAASADAVKIKVSVFTGEKSFDKEIQLGVYSAREGERVKIKELADLGVEPFEIAVIRVALSAAAQLPTTVVNKTSSLQITAVEPSFSALPSYKVRMINNSAKAVSAIAFAMTENGRTLLSGFPQGERGRSLIDAGEEVVRTMPVPTGYKPPFSPNEQNSPSLTLTVSTVIFEDGSYEGDAQSAIMFSAFTIGRKAQLRRILALLQNAAPTESLTKLEEQITALSREVDAAAFDELTKQFPTLTETEKSRWRNAAEGSAQSVKMGIIKELQGFRGNYPNPTADLTRLWLSEAKKQYGDWLARLR